MIEVEIDLLKCIICFEICKNGVESICCSTLFCEECFEISLKYNDKCPCCRKGKIQTRPAINIRKLIGSTYIECPICEFKDKRINMLHHIKTSHENQNLDKLFECKIFELYKPKLYNITHKHELTLIPNTEESNCRGSKIYGCALVKTKALIYACKACKIYYCTSCAYNNISSFKTKSHTHPLKHTEKPTSWYCDGSCISKLNRSIDKLKRFRCEECDFDLCESCLELNIIIN